MKTNTYIALLNDLYKLLPGNIATITLWSLASWNKFAEEMGPIITMMTGIAGFLTAVFTLYFAWYKLQCYKEDRRRLRKKYHENKDKK